MSVATAPVARPAEPVALPSDRDELLERSHAVLDAYDRGDAAGFGDALANGFLHFEGGAPSSRDEELASIAKRKPDAPHIGKRTWKQEQVVIGPDDAVFFGLSHEHMAGNDVHGGYDFEGWYTLAWRREGAAWKVGLWTWQRAGEAAQRDVWNEMFRNWIGFNKQPNQLLVDAVRSARPGRALDVAMGQGRTRCTSRRSAGRSPASTSPTRGYARPARRRRGASSRSRPSTRTSRHMTSASRSGIS